MFRSCQAPLFFNCCCRRCRERRHAQELALYIEQACIMSDKKSKKTEQAARVTPPGFNPTPIPVPVGREFPTGLKATCSRCKGEFDFNAANKHDVRTCTPQ
jgi:hypothetical protein